MKKLEEQIKELFESETKPKLRETAIQAHKEVKQQNNQDVIEKLRGKLMAPVLTFEQSAEKLLIVGNNALEDFEKENSDAKEPEKSNALKLFTEMITFEIQELVKSNISNKFHE